MTKSFICEYQNTLGIFILLSDGNVLTNLLLPKELFFPNPDDEENDDLPVFKIAKKYLDEYFAGKTTLLLPPLLPNVSEFTALVLNESLNIPYGETISYHELAKRLGKPNHARAVGNALGKNPLPIFIPCHRILKSDNTLGGYTGGLDFKIKLLELEGIINRSKS